MRMKLMIKKTTLLFMGVLVFSILATDDVRTHEIDKLESTERSLVDELASLSVYSGFDRADFPEVEWTEQASAGEVVDEKEELAKKTQNPISDLISLPFQNNFNYNVGPNDETQYVLNIQPVVPFDLGDRFNLITRTIAPVIYQPRMGPGMGSEFGLGDINITAWLSPKGTEGIVWGVGPILSMPTATDDILGSEKWSAGPSFVALKMEGPWVYGALVNNIWSFSGEDDRSDVNQMLLQPFVNYNIEDGWYVASSPIITADWKRNSDDTWTIPIGGGVGKIVMFGGKMPVNFQMQAFKNIVRPHHGPDWTFRFQVQLLFPKKKGTQPD